jgi:hypothetical protein
VPAEDSTAAVQRLAVEIVVPLTGLSKADALRQVRNVKLPVKGVDKPDIKLTNFVQTAPMAFDARTRALNSVTNLLECPPVIADEYCRRALEVLRTSPIHIPKKNGIANLEAQPNLDEAIELLDVLDREVPQPWTLVGGLMTQVHCAEMLVPPPRVTEDVDIAVSVFTHRNSLRSVTECLRKLEFEDKTPMAPKPKDQLSYRWVNAGVKIDVLVPEKVNDQTYAPRGVTQLNAVEMPGLQQAIMRTERVQIRGAGRRGSLRRPDLLGAIVVKSAAAVNDNRDRDRHRTDLVSLAWAASLHPGLSTFAQQVSAKDKRRISRALTGIRQPMWSAADDPEAAHDALLLLAGQ